MTDHLPVPAPRQQLALPSASTASLAAAGSRSIHQRRPRLERVTCVSYGGRLLAAAGEHVCCVWDTLTHELVARLVLPGAPVHAVWVERARGSVLMVAHGAEVTVFDLPRGTVRYSYQHQARVTSVHIADGSSTGGSIDSLGYVQVHDLGPGRLLQRLETPAGQPRVFFERDRFVLVDSDTHSAFYDLATGALRRRFPYDPLEGLNLDSPTTQTTLIAPSGRWLRWFDCSRHAHSYCVRDLGSTIQSIDIDRERGLVLAASEAGRIGLFSLQSGHPKAAYESFTVPVLFARFGAEASIYVAGGEALVMHLVEGQHARSYYDETPPLVAMAVPSQAGSVLLSNRDGGVTPVGLNEGRRMTPLLGHQGSVSAVTCMGNGVVTGAYDGVVRLFEAATGKQTMAIDLEQGPVQAVLVDEQNQRLWVGTWVGRVNEVELASGSLRSSVEAFPSTVRSLAQDAERGLLCAGGDRGELCLLDVTGTEAKIIEAGLQPGTVFRLQFDADGSVLATALDGVRRYEPALQAVRALYPGRTVRWFDRSAGRLASLSLSGELIVFDELARDQRGRTKIDSPFNHRSVAFLNAHRLLVASADGLMRVFDEQLQCVATLELLRDGFIWHTAPQANGHPGWLHTDRPDLLDVGELGQGGGLQTWGAADPRRARHLAKWTSASHVMQIVRGDPVAAPPTRGRLASALALAPVGLRLGWSR